MRGDTMSRAIEPLASRIKRYFARYKNPIRFDISVNGPERTVFLRARHIPVDALGTGYTIFTDVDLLITLKNNEAFEIRLTPINECSFDQCSYLEYVFSNVSELTINKDIYIRLSSTITDDEMMDYLEKLIETYIMLYKCKLIDDRKKEFEKARELLSKTKCSDIDAEIKEDLTDLIIQDMRKRLIGIKKAILEGEEIRNRYGIRAKYYRSTDLLYSDNKEEDHRIYQLLHRSEVLGDNTMWDHLYSLKTGGVPVFSAALLLYILYYSKKGFSMLTYDDCIFLNKFERALLKVTERDIFDKTISVLKFQKNLDNIIYRLKKTI